MTGLPTFVVPPTRFSFTDLDPSTMEGASLTSVTDTVTVHEVAAPRPSLALSSSVNVRNATFSKSNVPATFTLIKPLASVEN